MQPTHFNSIFSSGQLAPEQLLTFDECMESKDYLAAYRKLKTLPLIEQQENKEILFNHLTKENLYECICQIPDKQPKLELLSRLAKQYLDCNKIEPFIFIYKMVTFSEATDLFLHFIMRDNWLEGINLLWYFHLESNSIKEIVHIINNTALEIEHDVLLFNLGCFLIYYKRWDDCSIILEYLCDYKNLFEKEIETARKMNEDWIRLKQKICFEKELNQ